MNEVQRPCAFRDPSILTDSVLEEKYMSELPQDLDLESPEAEAIMVRSICDRSSCLLNLGMALRQVVSGGRPEPREDIGWAVPPDCSWHGEQAQS